MSMDDGRSETDRAFGLVAELFGSGLTHDQLAGLRERVEEFFKASSELRGVALDNADGFSIDVPSSIRPPDSGASV